MNTEDIRREIAERLKAIEGVGKVHPFERYASKHEALKGFYLNSRHLCGWYVTRLSCREEEFTTCFNKVFTDWQIRGFMGLEDAAASEIAFDAKIDAIRRDFRNTPLKSADATGLIQVNDIGPVMFCGILCHACDLRLQTVCAVPVGEDRDFDLVDFLSVKTDYDLYPPDGAAEAGDIVNLGGQE